ncbi:hypothetical protein VPH35_120790 [Triticum aestivum]
MEARRDHQQTSSGDPSPRRPRWVLLDSNIAALVTQRQQGSRRRDHPDAETVAEALSSGGRHVRVSFDFAAAPAVSRLRVDSPGLPDGSQIRSQIIAAHGDSVLIEIDTRTPDEVDNYERDSSDYFVYNADDAAADPSRPPSLSLLPPCHLTPRTQYEGKPRPKRFMPAETTALLRRGDEDLLVAQLTLYGAEGQVPLEAELCLLRSGAWEWELRRLPVLHDDGKWQELSFWETDAVIPVGDRFLYWVDYYRGVICSDAWEETPQLRYVSLPVKPRMERRPRHHASGSSYCAVCTTDGGGAVSFVEVCPRCCCGSPGATFCSRSRYAFNITTWTLRVDDDMAMGDRVSVVDSDELWSLPGYGGVPRIRPEYPIVSLDDPDVLCFMVHKIRYHMEDVDGDHAIRMIEVDAKRMELRSVVCYDDDDDFCSPPEFIPSMISQYLDASSRSSRPPAKRHEQAPTTAGATIINELVSSDNKAAMASPGEILATLREIGDLASDDMLRTYSVLACDVSQFKFKLLLALPKDMRKGYCLLLLEIQMYSWYDAGPCM